MGASIEGIDFFGFFVTNRDDDNGGDRPLSQMPDDFLAIHVGQTEIEENQIRPDGLNPLKSLFSIPDLIDACSLRPAEPHRESAGSIVRRPREALEDLASPSITPFENSVLVKTHCDPIRSNLLPGTQSVHTPGHSIFRLPNVVDEWRKPQPSAHGREVAQVPLPPKSLLYKGFPVWSAGAQADAGRSPTKRKKHHQMRLTQRRLHLFRGSLRNRRGDQPRRLRTSSRRGRFLGTRERIPIAVDIWRHKHQQNVKKTATAPKDYQRLLGATL